jgi:hypothetical protein
MVRRTYERKEGEKGGGEDEREGVLNRDRSTL